MFFCISYFITFEKCSHEISVRKSKETGYVILERDCCKSDVCDGDHDGYKMISCSTCKKPLCNNGTKCQPMKLIAFISLAIVAIKLNGIKHKLNYHL